MNKGFLSNWQRGELFSDKRSMTNSLVFCEKERELSGEHLKNWRKNYELYCTTKK